MGVSSTFFLDQLLPNDVSDFIMGTFMNGTRNIMKITVQYTTVINDDKRNKYTIENIFERAYFLDTVNIVARSHYLPREGGVMEEDDGSYYNSKKFYVLDDDKDMKQLKKDIIYYHANTVQYLDLLSSNPIVVTVTEYTLEDIIKLDQGGEQ